MRLLTLAVLFSMPFVAQAQDRSTPTKAWAVLEAAYKNKDAEAIIAGRDFELESLIIFKTFFDKSDPVMHDKRELFVEKLVEEKIAKIRAGSRDSTAFPLHEKISCVTMPERVIDKPEPELELESYVELELTCTPPKGKPMQPKLYFSQKNGQWRLFEIRWE